MFAAALLFERLLLGGELHLESIVEREFSSCHQDVMVMVHVIFFPAQC